MPRRDSLWFLLLAAVVCLSVRAPAVQTEPGSQLLGLLAGAPSGAGVEVSTEQRTAAKTARQRGVLVEWNSALGTPRSLRGTNLSTALSLPAPKSFSSGVSAFETKAQAIIYYLAPLYGDVAGVMEYRPRKAQRDNLGFHHVRLDQICRGVPVSGAQVIVHFDREGRVYQVNGEAIRDPELEVIPKISPAVAADEAIRNLAPQSGTALRNVDPSALVVLSRQSITRLAYEVNLVGEEKNSIPARWRAWVDASDRSLLLAYDDTHFIAPPSTNGADVQIKGCILPGEGGQAVALTGWLENNGVYYLHNTNWSWQVYNLATAGPDSGTYAFRTHDDWGSSDPSEVSIARNLDVIQRYYRGIHGRHSYDDAGIFVQANVHFSFNYANAFWSGGAFYFGDGNGSTAGPMGVLDIAAHEYAHAVTDYSAQLMYADEPGALNESFSDIFAVCVEFFAQADNRSLYPGKAAGTADWLMGEDCWLAAPALRDLRDPHNNATVGTQLQPSRYSGPFWRTGTGDNGGVHWNSGVQNFFFYLLSEGGQGTNDGIAYSISGIGITNAASVAYRALTVYCTPGTDYRAVRGAWISAARDLNTNWVASVADAWSAVGIGSLSLSPSSLVFRGPQGGPFTCLAPQIELYNSGAMPVAWGVVSTQAWLQLYSPGGTMPPFGGTTLAISTAAQAQLIPVGLYTNNLVFTNQQTADALISQVCLYVGQPVFFTEVFDNNDLDLSYSSVTFSPDRSAGLYAACREVATEFPTDPAGGMALGLGDDAFQQLTLSGANSISLYGRRTNVFFVGSNGYITTGKGDVSNLPTLANHFARVRLAALLDDLDPLEGGCISWRELPDRAAITFQDVPVFGNPTLINSFQIELFYDGVIRITYLDLAVRNGLAGLSAGTGVPPAFAESDLSGSGSCQLSLTLLVPTQAAEDDGILAGQGAVSIPIPLATNLFVRLASGNTNEILAQPTAVIVAGKTNVTFDLMVVDDTRIDGTQNVTVSAAVAGWVPGYASIAVLDNESPVLILEVPSAATGCSGRLTNAGVVTIPGTLPTNLVVSVFCDNAVMVQAPAEVTIPAGVFSNRFDIVVNDSPLASGPVTVTLAVSAPGFSSATNSITVTVEGIPSPPEIVLLTEFNAVNGVLSLSLTNRLGSVLSGTKVAVYRATNLILPEWELLTNQLVPTNGLLRLEDLDTRRFPAQFFRVRYVP